MRSYVSDVGLSVFRIIFIRAGPAVLRVLFGNVIVSVAES